MVSILIFNVVITLIVILLLNCSYVPMATQLAIMILLKCVPLNFIY